MHLLLDTHVLLAMLDKKPDRLGRRIASAIALADAQLYLSVASLWEVAIKTRLRKLVFERNYKSCLNCWRLYAWN
jgi:PIN domain nuclease of toxin-antitoxin system